MYWVHSLLWKEPRMLPDSSIDICILYLLPKLLPSLEKGFRISKNRWGPALWLDLKPHYSVMENVLLMWLFPLSFLSFLAGSGVSEHRELARLDFLVSSISSPVERKGSCILSLHSISYREALWRQSQELVEKVSRFILTCASGDVKRSCVVALNWIQAANPMVIWHVI